ncbi:MAG: hypothetical protein QW270_02735 [Candidatus Bathyarchaeia archaeon]
MGKASLKRQVLECLFFILFISVIGYVLVYPFSVFNFEYYRRNLLPSYYVAAFFGAFVVVYVYFVVPRFIIRQCRSCGSRNMRFGRGRGGGFVCDDCGSVFDFDIQRDAKKIILVVALPFLFISVFSLCGFILAGLTLDFDLVRLAVVVSVWMPSLVTFFIGLAIFNKSTYFNKHSTLFSILLIISIFVVPILLFIAFDAIIFYGLRWLQSVLFP